MRYDLHLRHACALAMLAGLLATSACQPLSGDGDDVVAGEAALAVAGSFFQLRRVADIPVTGSDPYHRGAVRIARDDSRSELLVLALDGNIYRLSPAAAPSGFSGPLYTAGQTGIASPQGMAIDASGTIYLVGNTLDTAAKLNTPRVRKGVRTGSGDARTWSDLVVAAAYPASNTAFDHQWNGVVVSPDGASLYVNSGSRTDHGEVESGQGAWPNTRDVSQTARVFKFPTNQLTQLDAGNAEQFTFVRSGTRNSFTPAFNALGELFAGDNGGDRDDNDELNWLRAGEHYGFPWRVGDSINPQQFASYAGGYGDPLVGLSQYAYATLHSFVNDPGFPPAPLVAFSAPVQNLGPDADSYRDPKTGGLRDASSLGASLGSFTAHRSPTGLVFDVRGELPGSYRQGAFIMGFTPPAANEETGPFVDHGRDLLFLQLTKSAAGDRYTMNSTKIVGGFNNPIDAAIHNGKLYVADSSFYTGQPSPIWELGLPSLPEQASAAPPAPTNVRVSTSQTSASLRWDKMSAQVGIPVYPSGATSYDVLRSTVSGSGYVVVANVATPAYEDPQLSSGTTYYYKVRSKNDAGTADSAQVVAPLTALADIPFASAPPVADGQRDALYNAGPTLPIAKLIGGTVSSASDLGPSYSALWDTTNLYVLVTVLDEALRNDSSNPWDDDSVEVYIDGDNSKATSYGADDYQFVFGWGDSTALEAHGKSVAGLSFQTAIIAGGYQLELTIPWSSINVNVKSIAERKFGLDVHVNDDDDGAGRDGKKSWFVTIDQSWSNPSLFATARERDLPLTFVTCPSVGGDADVTLTTTAPVLDGVADASGFWNAATAFAVDKVIVGTVSSSADLSGTYRARWDQSFLYVFVSVLDEALRNDSPNPWDDDSVELYLDDDNSKTTSYGPDDYQLVLGWGDSTVVEAHGKSTAGIQFAQSSIAGGYAIELRIPWPTLSTVVGASDTRRFGIDVHLNDDDDGGSRDGKKSWRAATDVAWTDPSVIGTARLRQCPSSSS